MKFYGFWRSIASFRVRTALAYKGIKPDEVIDIDLLQGKQRDEAYRKVNPQMLIPALFEDDKSPMLFQSMAIMEYLEETRPQPPLLPKDAFGRARVRGLSQIVVSDAHPMSVPRVRGYLTKDLGLSEERMLTWVRHWQSEALSALETHLSRDKTTGKYCHGDAVTIADICLAGQVVGSGFFKTDMKPYPTVMRIFDACMVLDAFAKSHPLKQPGAPEKV
ncbi:MAG: maleylacetoacetate isomerase [Alphaproteobacteria bacterium]|nr:maleylacetoacetate isomerase [Alphaproteobacteria bacterium]